MKKLNENQDTLIEQSATQIEHHGLIRKSPAKNAGYTPPQI